MVWFETQEANTSIQDLNETTSYISKEYEPRKQRINIDNQDKIHTNRAKEKEQPTQHSQHWAHSPKNSTNRSEQNKEQRILTLKQQERLKEEQ